MSLISWMKENSIALINIILTAFNISIFYISMRMTLKFSKITEIFQKSKLYINLIAGGNEYLLNFENKGIIPINSIDIELSLELIDRRNIKKFDKINPLKYIRDTFLMDNESFSISLTDKIDKILKENEVIRMEVQAMSYFDDEITGETIEYEEEYRRLRKEVDIILNIVINYIVYGQKKKIDKKYSVSLYHETIFNPYQDDYNSRVKEISGKWVT